MNCVNCKQPCESIDRIPILLVCGHALCEQCVNKSNPYTCIICNKTSNQMPDFKKATEAIEDALKILETAVKDCHSASRRINESYDAETKKIKAFTLHLYAILQMQEAAALGKLSALKSQQLHSVSEQHTKLEKQIQKRKAVLKSAKDMIPGEAPLAADLKKYIVELGINTTALKMVPLTPFKCLLKEEVRGLLTNCIKIDDGNLNNLPTKPNQTEDMYLGEPKNSRPTVSHTSSLHKEAAEEERDLISLLDTTIDNIFSPVRETAADFLRKVGTGKSLDLKKETAIAESIKNHQQSRDGVFVADLLQISTDTAEDDLSKDIATSEGDLSKDVPTAKEDLPKDVPTAEKDSSKDVSTSKKDLSKDVATAEEDLYEVVASKAEDGLQHEVEQVVSTLSKSSIKDIEKFVSFDVKISENFSVETDAKLLSITTTSETSQLKNITLCNDKPNTNKYSFPEDFDSVNTRSFGRSLEMSLTENIQSVQSQDELSSCMAALEGCEALGIEAHSFNPSQQPGSPSDQWASGGARPKVPLPDDIPVDESSTEILESYPIRNASSTSSLLSVSSCGTSSLLPGKEMPLLMEESVRVTHIENPSLFCVQRSVDYKKIKILSKKFKNVAKKSGKIAEIIPFVGKVYLSHCTEDDSWCRALVTAVKPESNEVDIRYVDYGNSEKIKMYKLRDCPTKFQLDQMPSFKIMCSLWEIQPARGDVWDSEAIATFRNLVADSSLQLCVIRCETENFNSKCLVDLRRPGKTVGLAYNPPLSIREVLVFLEFAVFVNYSSEDQYNKHRAPARGYHFPEIPFGVDKVKVLIGNITSPANVYLQLWSCSEYLSLLMEDMELFYNSIQDELMLDWLIYSPRIGMMCVAKYTGDGRWYRAIIEDLPGNKKVDVSYVDFGNKERLWYKQIRKIADKFTLLPAQAIPCSLIDIEPCNDIWTEEVVELMIYMCESQDIFASFHSYENQKMFASLVVSAEGSEVDVRDQLIEMGAARSTSKKKYKKLAGRIYSFAEEKVQKESRGSNFIEEKIKKETSFHQRGEVVTCLAVTSPTCIHLRLASKVTSYFQFQKSLQIAMKGKSQLSDYSPTTQDVCVIKLQKDFSRVRVLEIKECEAVVHLIDGGSIKNVPVSELLSLPDAFDMTEDFSVTGSLTGITPPGGQDKWPGITKDCLEELLSSRNTLYMRPLGEPKLHPDHKIKVMPVNILYMDEKLGGPFEANSQVYVSISDLLVEEGLALPVKGNSPEGNVLDKADDYSYKTPVPFSKGKQSSVDCHFSLEKESERILNHEGETLGITDWLPCSIPEKMEFSATPSFVDEKGIIYLQHAHSSRTLDMISEGQTIQFANSCASDNDLCWSQGDPVIAKFFLDNKWYRATVLKLLESGKVLIQFVDYGNTDEVNLSDLRRDIIYDQIPIQCFKAVLHCTEPRNLDGYWETQVLDFLHKTIVEKECNVTLMEKPRPGKPLEVHLVVKEHQLDVIALLVEKLKLCQRVKPKVYHEDNPDVVVESEAAYLTDFPVVCLPPLSLPSKPSEKVSIKVTAIRDPAHVYISPLHAEESMDKACFQDVVAYKEFFVSVNKDTSQLKDVIDPKIGAVYLGKFSTQWYRIQILGKYSDNVTALFVDTGNFEDLSLKDLRECPGNGKKIPAMAVGVKLHRVESPLGPDHWSDEAMMAMIDCLMSDEKIFLASIMNRGSPAEVELYHKELDKLAYADLIAGGLISLRKEIVGSVENKSEEV